MMSRFQPIFRYYEFDNGNKVVVEIDPQDGSDWPYHFLIYCEYNATTGQWDLYKKEKVTLNLSESDKIAAIKEACFQLVQMQNEDTSSA